MIPDEIERLRVCSQEIAEILYRNTAESELNYLDGTCEKCALANVRAR